MNLLEGGVTQPGKSPSPENGTVPLVYNNIHEELSIHDSKPEKGRITHKNGPASPKKGGFAEPFIVIRNAYAFNASRNAFMVVSPTC